MHLDLPFGEAGKQLIQELDIGSNWKVQGGNIPEAATGMVLESIGRDLLVFLAASVLVTPVATALGVTPILGYLLAGALLGPHGFDVFANSKADVELGDFGILFLLFSEGLEVSSSRLKKLANYLPLGLAQISLCTGILTAAILLGGPEFLERFLPLDGGLINIHNPSEALILALAGTLSTSAFVFPVLKEREWEEEESGQAATSILLLQDLAVAPLLVLLPYVVGQGPTDYTAIGFLTAKATLGFGLVVYVGSYVLRKLFELVARARSTETFVALCLLVSVGMGAIAQSLGLTDTAGAFAAGVLLANTNYRAQIQADILPFKGILLGIFFMDAGSSFDTDLVLSEWPTVLTGALSLIFLKGVTLFSATRVPRWLEPNRLPTADGVRLAFLLSGGGEFAFVVLALAEKLGALPDELGGLLTAVVLITMSLTPVLGSFAGFASEPFSEGDAIDVTFVSDNNKEIIEEEENESQKIANDAVIVCGYGSIGKSLLKTLGQEYGENSQFNHNYDGLPRIVAFDSAPELANMDDVLSPVDHTLVMFGNAQSAEVLTNSGVTEPAAIFVAYENYADVVSCTARLRTAFPVTPIYARAQTRGEALYLKSVGASEVIVESDEMPRSAVALLKADNRAESWMAVPRSEQLGSQPLYKAAAAAAGVTPLEVDHLLELFECLDSSKSGKVDAQVLAMIMRRSNSGIASDDEIEFMEAWIQSVVSSPVDVIEFCRLYALAPKKIQEALGDACIL